MVSTVTKTCLYEEHVKLGAKMVPFAGWEMPIQYSGILEEHKCVRENAGIFDVSHMGEVFISGKDALSFLQKLVPQDISKLTSGHAIYCQMTNKTGGIIDDLIIYKLEDKNENPEFLLIINASRVKEDLSWIVENKSTENFDVKIDNQSNNYSLLAIQGPKSNDIMDFAGIKKEDQPAYFEIKKAVINDSDVYISRTGYTGEDGFEILVKNEDAAKFWNFLLEKGKNWGLKPIGLGARDTLRLEAALLLYGQDMDENITPVEASLSWSIPKDKTENYNGKKTIMAQFDSKPSKRLISFKMIERAIPRHNYEIYKNDQKIGVVTSGGVAPTIHENIGLGYVSTKETLSVNSEIFIKIRDKFCKAQITKRPFVQKKNKLVK
jgi:aminomethyltransferase